MPSYALAYVSERPLPLILVRLRYSCSVAEINLGIVCACVPVVFPIMKAIGMKVTSTGSTWRRYLLVKYQRSERTPDTVITEDSTAKGPFAEIPKGNLRTLLSFVRGSHRSQRGKSQGGITVTQATEIELAPYSELRSIDMEYHSYLGNGPQKGAHTARAQRG